MRLNEYQQLASDTAIKKGTDLPTLMYRTLGLCGEAGEIAEHVKKAFRDDGGITPERRKRLIEEGGDALWYLATIFDFLGIPLEEVAERNLQKLADRKARGVLGGSGDSR